MIAAIFVVISVLLIVGIYQKKTNNICESTKRLDGKTALVTGGTAGMGLQVATELARRGARVLVCGPCAQEGRAASESIARAAGSRRVHYRVLDLAELASVRRLAAALLAEEDALHLLVNNAGVGGPGGRTTSDHMDEIMQVNYFGAFLLTLLLLPLLKKSGQPGEPSRIVNTASVLHNLGFADFNDLSKKLKTGIARSYCDSKFCLVLFTRELAKKLVGENVVVNTVDPGAVGTRIFKSYFSSLGRVVTWFFFFFFKTPWQGAQTALHVALDEAAGSVSGEYFKNCRFSRAVYRAYDDKLASQVWEESLRKVKFEEEGIIIRE